MQWPLPLEYANALRDEPYLALLYSAQPNGYTGRHSLLAWGLEEAVHGNSFDPLATKLTQTKGRYDNTWFGYFGYGLKNALEELPTDAPMRFSLPDLWMGRFRHLLLFDHDEHSVHDCGSEPSRLSNIQLEELQPIPPVAPQSLSSNMSKQAYLAKAAQVLDAIHRGDLYQANLTRKFGGRFTQTPDGFSLYHRLCTHSPAPFSAFLRMAGTEIISSSPESFLEINEMGRIIARPIKGTTPRGNTPQEDEQLKQELLASAKDRAENLMIVDLLRNDLSRTAIPGSVKVDNLFECASLPSVHHLYSTIEAQQAPGRSTLDTIKACFPPGSMTGAPKIAAIELCSQLEEAARGVYSGALGWLGGDGSAHLSVVIRTLILQGQEFEFQVGGGIVADSTPEGEWAESLLKAKGMAAALGISQEELSGI